MFRILSDLAVCPGAQRPGEQTVTSHQPCSASARSAGRSAGLTLVELLVSMFIFGLLLTLVSQFFTLTSKDSMQSLNRSELQQEVLNAQQLIAANLKDAWYVYPSGQSITMTTTALTQKPSGGNAWMVGTDPIIAMVLLPKTPGAACDPASSNVDGCFRFRAYYPVRRSVWIGGVGSDSWRNPGADPANDAATWVLAEYRANVALTAQQVANITRGSAVPTVTPGQTPNLLADYIAPTTDTGATYTMFTHGADGRSATIRLAVKRAVGGNTLRLPDKTGTYVLTTAFNNVGKRPF